MMIGRRSRIRPRVIVTSRRAIRTKTFVDVDGRKQVDDSKGHLAGDALLRLGISRSTFYAQASARYASPNLVGGS
jgi:predicted signal transduction protein with EAL and GGDEF domain